MCGYRPALRQCCTLPDLWFQRVRSTSGPMSHPPSARTSSLARFQSRCFHDYDTGRQVDTQAPEFGWALVPEGTRRLILGLNKHCDLRDAVIIR